MPTNAEDGSLVIKQWWWEPGVHPSPEMQAALRDCFGRFLAYLGADRLQIDGQAEEAAGLDWLTVKALAG